MYQHCKATEDKDMTPFDFLTDHLINIDGLFDKHENGDEQKPHTPIQYHHNGQLTIPLISSFEFSVVEFPPTEIKLTIYSMNCIPSDYISKIFRPPILI